MGLSSNTIIHFTSEKDSLKGILSDNFRLKYCKETIRWDDESKYNLHIPMVSFCDIPLSQIKNHISKYGHYGIGLTREWAIKNGLNPVLYVQSGSNLANSYKCFVKALPKLVDIKVNENGEEAVKQFLDVLRYVKNYEAPLIRGAEITESYRFSDEREWRYVPDFSSSCEMMYTKTTYSKEKADKSLSGMRLNFEPNDVKYIIIKSDEEISEFIAHLRDAKGTKYSHHDVERLATRILTSEQIHDDI